MTGDDGGSPRLVHLLGTDRASHRQQCVLALGLDPVAQGLFWDFKLARGAAYALL